MKLEAQQDREEEKEDKERDGSFPEKSAWKEPNEEREKTSTGESDGERENRVNEAEKEESGSIPEWKKRKRREALEKLRREPCEDNLWACIVAFEGYPFYTASGLPFAYALKTGRNGLPTRELWINRRAQSKSLSWGSVRLAYRKAREMTGEEIGRPKALGDIRGISYVYPLLWKFGLIRVPDQIREKMLPENACADSSAGQEKK